MADQLSLSSRATAQPEPSDECTGQASDEDLLDMLIVRMLLERVSGRTLSLFTMDEPQAEGVDAPPPQGLEAPPPAAGEGSVGWGLELHVEETRTEIEQTHFSAAGIVKTADGAEIAFEVDVGMSRELVEKHQLDIRAGDALKDPLMINYGGNSAQLTQTRFAFDIDADGALDNIAFVKPGSGFLALDRNGNGIVDDGSELFGPRTGSGFSELAEFDEDQNGWIDEGDPIFEGLRIWSRDGAGNDQLVALGSRAGAIYLGNVATPFTLEGAPGEQAGRVAATGIYLEEDGTVKTVQELDLMA